MIYKTLGKTGMDVSLIGFGASPLGNEFGDTDVKEGERAVHHAIDQGINYFDVSPYYGRTLAEQRLGLALQGKRNDIYLATKMGRYDAKLPEGFDFSADRVYTSIHESLKRLRTDVIDVFQVHDVEFGHKSQIMEETIPAMLDLKQQGKVRFVGITGYPLKLLNEIATSTDIDTILSYCRYNLMDTTMDELLTPLVVKKQLGLINASPLHMRILTNKGAPDWHPAPRRVKLAGEQAAAYCADHGVDIATLALQFAVQHKHVATTLVGMSKLRHVETNITAVSKKPDPDILAGVLDIIKPAANVVWQSGLVKNNDSGAIPPDPRINKESTS